MLPIEIRPFIYWVGVNDRQTELFEGLWSIRKEGVSYNSYLINDTKKVMIDLCSKMTTDELLDPVIDGEMYYGFDQLSVRLGPSLSFPVIPSKD